MKEFKTSVIEKLKADIEYYESNADAGRALSDDVYPVLKRIKATMHKIGLDYCTVNLIKLGSKRYAKYENKLDCSKWIMLGDEQ